MIPRRFIKSFSAALPFRLLSWASNPKVVAVFYHGLSNHPLPHLKHLYPLVSVKQFSDDLDFLLRHFNLVDIKEFIHVSCKTVSNSKPVLLLSFDDGFKEVATEVAPILLSKGVPATFFVNPTFVGNRQMLYRCKQSLITERVLNMGKAFSLPKTASQVFNSLDDSPTSFVKWLMSINYNDVDLIDRIANELNVDIDLYLADIKPYMNLDELKDLGRQGFTIGAHSMDHPNFSSIPLNHQIDQVAQSLQWVQDNIAGQPRVFAFPFTDFGLSDDLYRHFLIDNPDLCDMMFGTAGFKPTSTGKFVHRIPMEVTNKSARQVIKGEFFYYFLKRIVGKHKVTLPV